MTGTTQFYDEKANFLFYGEDSTFLDAFINEAYDVSGRVLDEETHSFLQFEYRFYSINEANEYFDKIKNKYPLSEIKIYKNTWQECRVYG